MYKNEESSHSEKETARFFSEFLHSVYTPKKPYTLKDIRKKKSVLINIDVSKATNRSIWTDLYITKSRDPHKLSLVFFKRKLLWKLVLL